MGQVIEKRACTNDKCSSSDGLVVYKQDDGTHNATCFVCGHFDPDPYRIGVSHSVSTHANKETSEVVPARSTPITGTIPTKDKQTILDECLSFPIRALHDRGITKETCEHFDVRVALSPTDGHTITHHYYPRTKKNKLSSFKKRIVSTKDFRSVGDGQGVELFGQSVCKPNGKKLFITEGECDALALYQTLRLHSSMDWNPAVVSLSNGSASASKDISENFDFVQTYDEIILCFDQDDPGQAAVDDVCPLLAGKVYIAKFSEKDANDMVLKGKSHELYWDVMKHARAYMPDNIINYGECWDRFKHGKNKVCYPYPESWTDINAKTYGTRLGSLVTITSGSGMGGLTFSPFMW